MLISALLTAVGFWLCVKFIKTEKGKFLVLKISALITVALHFSSLWIDFFSTGSAVMQESMLLPIYPCNVCMWLLLLTAFCKNRETTFFKVLSEFVFWGGTVCGSIGIILNENYGATPSLADYEILKGLLSHSTMLFGCIYLLVSGIVKIRVFNTLSVACGLLFFLVDGGIINLLYAIFKLEPCNSMYMLHSPFANMPWLTPYLMGLVGVLLVFGVTALYERLTMQKEERTLTKLFKRRNLK